MSNRLTNSMQFRKMTLAAARRIVVKLGTQVLSTSTGTVDLRFLKSIARQVTYLREHGFEVTLVSSGAIGVGRAELGLTKRPTDVSQLQAIAAVGQYGLMSKMHRAFEPLGLRVAQVLLTRGDFEDRVRFLNLRNCVMRLHKMGCVPIVNENDTVAVEELRFGDNDMLAALMCNALRADALVLLTVVDGLIDPNGKKVDLVREVVRVRGMARKETSKAGVGGMIAKLEAARLVTNAGEAAVIANGREPNVLLKLFQAKPVGTVFAPSRSKLDSRRRWIGLTKRPAGVITVDVGAANALSKHGKSLLATGICATTLGYERGQVVQINDSTGQRIAQGLTNYSAEDVQRIMGFRSNQLAKILGRAPYTEVIHRDNLMLVKP